MEKSGQGFWAAQGKNTQCELFIFARGMRGASDFFGWGCLADKCISFVYPGSHTRCVRCFLIQFSMGYTTDGQDWFGLPRESALCNKLMSTVGPVTKK